MERYWGRNRGKPLLNEHEKVGPPHTSEEDTQEHPVKAPSPPEEANARAKRTERRDEERLRVEKTTLVVGFFGLVGLLFTLWQTRISTEAVTKQLELSERPWISVDLVAMRPLVFDENSNVSVWVQFVLKNLGHSPARSAQIRFQVVEVPDRSRGYTTQHEMCVSAENEPESMGVRHAIMPGEQVVRIEHLRAVGLLAQKSNPQISNRPLLSLAVVGCVEYEFTFVAGFHQTGFFFDLVKLDPTEPQLGFALELPEGEAQVAHVGFRKDAFGSYAY